MARSDAQENRQRILTAAREALAADPEVSMNQIAQRAGVGAGTLYRNFAHREALVLAVYQHEIDRIVDSVPALLETLAPLEALRQWTISLVEAMRQKHELGSALSGEAHQAVAAQTYAPVLSAIARLLDAGKADGVVRADADPRDFLQFTGALWRATSGAEDRSTPMLDLLLDGLRARG